MFMKSPTTDCKTLKGAEQNYLTQLGTLAQNFQAKEKE